MNYFDTLRKIQNKELQNLVTQISDGEYNYFRKLESASPMWKEYERITKSIEYVVDIRC